jgi:O-6-methylguanine DNA methyltransferase
VVVAHDFDFVDAASGGDAPGRLRAGPRMGAVSPPSGTLAPKSSQVGNAFAPISRNGRVPGASNTADELAARVADYLAGGTTPMIDIELDLSWTTPFQRAVADALRAVPRGEVVTYGELAAQAGYPGAARAAGSFCATNRFALFVPCHRVVSANGIGGYGSAGVAVKRRLLALEGVVV